MTSESAIDLTPDQLAFIRQAAARWRTDEAGPLMLEALRKAEVSLSDAEKILRDERYNLSAIDIQRTLESVRAAIAAAE